MSWKFQLSWHNISVSNRTPFVSVLIILTISNRFLSVNIRYCKYLHRVESCLFFFLIFFLTTPCHMEALCPGIKSKLELRPMQQLQQQWILSPLHHGRNSYIGVLRVSSLFKIFYLLLIKYNIFYWLLIKYKYWLLI